MVSLNERGSKRKFLKRGKSNEAKSKWLNRISLSYRFA
jgi:hypothetical protein